MNEMVIYVAGAGHSGSTLLDLILGNHSNITSLGEVHYFREYLKDSDLEPCPCGEPYMTCLRWSDVLGKFRSLVGCDGDEIPMVSPPSSKMVNRYWPRPHECLLFMGSRTAWKLAAKRIGSVSLHNAAARNSMLLYQAVRQVTGRQHVVDSSKDAVRMKNLYLSDPSAVRVIHLVRDGRSAVFSDLKRENRTIRKLQAHGLLLRSMKEENREVIARIACRNWLVQNLKVHLMLQSVPAAHTIRIRYEDLCRTPEESISRLLGFLGLRLEDGLTALRKEKSHIIGGNWMRFRTEETEIRLDEKWRHQLTPEFLRLFGRWAGWLNRAYGYRS